MIWMIMMCYAFYLAYKAKTAEMFINNNPEHQSVRDAKIMLGWHYFAAMVIMGAYPFSLTYYTDNLITHLVIIIPVALIGIATWFEWKGDIDVSNQWIKRAFFALCVGVILNAFLVPVDAYNFPDAPVTSISKD